MEFFSDYGFLSASTHSVKYASLERDDDTLFPAAK